MPNPRKPRTFIPLEIPSKYTRYTVSKCMRKAVVVWLSCQMSMEVLMLGEGSEATSLEPGNNY